MKRRKKLVFLHSTISITNKKHFQEIFYVDHITPTIFSLRFMNSISSYIKRKCHDSVQQLVILCAAITVRLGNMVFCNDEICAILLNVEWKYGVIALVVFLRIS